MDDSIKSKIIKNVDTGCWEWTGYVNYNGYGHLKRNGVTHRAHKYIYCLCYKVCIINTYEIDHICRNRKCVNPAHLEVVTREENQRRGVGNVAMVNAAKGRCPQCFGEYVYMSGCRRCLSCYMEKQSIWKDANLEDQRAKARERMRRIRMLRKKKV